MKKIVAIFSLFLCLTIQAQNIHIAAAGNLRYVLDEIKSSYVAKHPKVDVDINLGASGALYQQIINGASFDIFMAADRAFPDKLKAQGVTSGDVKIYVYGKLVLWSNVVDVSKGTAILTDKSVNRIAIAKPDVAPYGERAVQCLNYYHLFDKLKDKLVYADNIAQTAQFAQTGNAEVAFIALSLAMEMKDKGKYFLLDTKSYKPVEQACVLLKEGGSNPEAAKFMAFVLSDECKVIFKKYGYTIPGSKE
jgi:molybdate transport system substrate-binding protein